MQLLKFTVEIWQEIHDFKDMAVINFEVQSIQIW